MIAMNVNVSEASGRGRGDGKVSESMKQEVVQVFYVSLAVMETTSHLKSIVGIVKRKCQSYSGAFAKE